jgi:23S rRNA (pseudouridine1915-N3)-methyltransferase
MRLLIAAVGRLKQGPERELFAHYLARAEAAGRTLGLTPVAAIEIAEAKVATMSARLKSEAEALIAKLPPAHKLIALERTGKSLSSEAFARLLAKHRDDGTQGLAFLVGGADGLGEQALAKAELMLSLSSMTLPHGLARIVLAEQIYRAVTIIAGHPYHRA